MIHPDCVSAVNPCHIINYHVIIVLVLVYTFDHSNIRLHIYLYCRCVCVIYQQRRYIFDLRQLRCFLVPIFQHPENIWPKCDLMKCLTKRAYLEISFLFKLILSNTQFCLNEASITAIMVVKYIQSNIRIFFLIKQVKCYRFNSILFISVQIWVQMN